LSIFGAIPALFGYKFGHVADSQNRFRVIGMGLFGIALIAVSIGFLTHYWFKIVGVFFLGVILELFSVTQSSLITTLGPAATYGKRGSAFEGVITFGDLLAPLLLGVGFDVLGFTKTVILIAGAGAALGASYWAISE
jgi:MFS family permease